MTPPIMHAGHWAVNLLYVLPLLIAVGVLGYQSLKDRRRGTGERSEPPAPVDAPPPPA